MVQTLETDLITLSNHLETLIANGVLVLDGYYSEDQVSEMLNEFDQLEMWLANTCKSDNSFQTFFHLDNDIGKRARKEAPLITNVADNPFFQQLIWNYYEHFGYLPSEDGLTTRFDLEHNKTVGPSNNSIWHFDRVPSLKVAVLLNDETGKNGATEVIPKSHLLSKKLMKEQLEKNPNPLKLKNYFIDLKISNENKPCQYRARGTVVIFDTMAIHRGGEILEEGHYRKTFRCAFQVRSMTSTFIGSDIDKIEEPRFTYSELHHPFTHERDRSKVNPSLLYKTV